MHTLIAVYERHARQTERTALSQAGGHSATYICHSYNRSLNMSLTQKPLKVLFLHRLYLTYINKSMTS